MKGIKIALTLCLVTLMICNNDSLGDRLRGFKDNISNKFIDATKDFHFQEKIQYTKDYFAGLKNKFDEATLKAKGNFSDAYNQVKTTSEKAIKQLDEWRIKAVSLAKVQYSNFKDSKLLATKYAEIEKAYNEKSAYIKTIFNDKKDQLINLFKDEKKNEENKEEEKKDEEKKDEEKKEEENEEKTLLELF